MEKESLRPGTLVRYYAFWGLLKKEVAPGSHILDLGGFDGFFDSKLKKAVKNLEITVVDLDKKGLEKAKQRGLKTLHVSALKLPFKDCSIDIIFCFDVLEHVKHDSQLIKEASRLLKNGGKLILSVPDEKGVTFPLLNRQKNKTIDFSWGHLRAGYSLPKLRRMFSKNNLRIIFKTKYFNFLTRFAYGQKFLSGSSFPGRGIFFRSVIKLEPLLKLGSREHLLIAEK